MITFQANYLNSATIQRINNYKPCSKKIAFIELNPNSVSDVLALHKTAIKWDKNGGEGFAYDICRAINKGIKDRFFALTTQQDNFDRLNSNQILAEAQVKTENEGEEFIEYLQVDPDNTNLAAEPQFSHIGSTMLHCLKTLFNGKKIGLDSVKSAILFYLKNGFKDIGSSSDDERRMLWESSPTTLH